MQLLINLADDALRTYRGAHFEHITRTGGAGLSGVYDRWFGIDTLEQRCIVGVAFRPGGASPFFRVPASAVRNHHVDLADVWPDDGAVVRERLLEQPTAAARLALVQAILLDHFVAPSRIDPAIAAAMALLEAGRSVGAVASRTNLSARTLERRFMDHVGVSPKVFARLRRFQQTLSAVAEGAVDWTDVAVAHGYYDQSHLHRDFALFTGVTPTQYKARGREALNHIAV